MRLAPGRLPSTAKFSKSKANPSKKIKCVSVPFSENLSCTVSTSSLKRKIAPRSSLQFKVGPQFSPTVFTQKIIDSMGREVLPVLCPRIDRGFELIDNEWIGYKRNYFTLVSSFYFENLSFEEFSKEDYYLFNPSINQLIRVKYFAIKLVSKCADNDILTHINLIQHTAKRDKGPQFQPPTHPVVPSELPDHDIIRESANVRNIGKIHKLDSIFYFDREEKSDFNLNIRGLRDYPHDKIFKVARYERVQFASSINYKKPSLNNKRFKLFVELVGFTENDEYISLAYTETPPLIVRGRSPSNYIHSQPNSKVQTQRSAKRSKRISMSQTPNKNDDRGDIESKTEVSEVIPIAPELDPSLCGLEKTNIDNHVEDDKASELKTTFPPGFSFDDVDTYEILLSANKQLDNKMNAGSGNPKKRGRKPKSKAEKQNQIPEEKILRPAIPKNYKVTNGILEKKVDLSIRNRYSNSKMEKCISNPSTEYNEGLYINSESKENLNELGYCTPLWPPFEPKNSFGRMFNDENIENQSFIYPESDILFRDIEMKLYDNPSFSKSPNPELSSFPFIEAKSFTNSINSNRSADNICAYSLDESRPYDNDLLIVKNRAETLEKANYNLDLERAAFYAKPSDVLDFNDDGPSFIAVD
ncbi:hypothetical protein WICMUC_002188 [Wickerhamomyces mucosus]|uniref:NDT80 domain-containing protein n=1 Tax=Wickerhamomyces mucosus TaxID=1378264 RepID=A0A9P8PQ59_9ASCO|nr:hypothetical protein WICMUC_002188 [Wickerhamomyces mucosus]